ncbi:electron transport complex protein RnfD [Lachnospiraceae bacterium KM106-2]|nr:electron transport complex protein RnfD [Lachnospiraceae bacterium KM106-2]
MADVIIALIPASAWGVYTFGWSAFYTIMACILTSVGAEFLYQKLMKKKATPYDLSAFLTGLLLALNLPAGTPWWLPIIGSLFAIIVVKQVYGGLGQNFMNPALGARVFLLISFATQMSTFTLDGVTGATPLALLREGTTTDLKDMFFGNIGGTIGEVSTLMLLIGAAYLLIKKVISWRIPVMYLGSFAIFIVLFGGHGCDINYLAAQLCGGGLMLGAFFMATDYVTSPITPMGQIIFGVVLGILTGIFRVFGGSAEGVSYAIIFSNLLVPLIEKVTIPMAFGKGRVKDGK